ncbi:NlpC/P60 family protein [Syntrophomonas curvata]
MKKKALTVIAVLVFTLGLMATPARTIVAQPFIKIISSPADCRYGLRPIVSGSELKSNRNSTIKVTENSLPRVTFPSGESVYIPRYVDSSRSSAAVSDARPKPVAAVKPAPREEPGNQGGKANNTAKPTLPDQKSTISKQADKPPVTAQTSQTAQKQDKPKVAAQEEKNLTLAASADTKSDLAAVKSFRAVYDDSPAHALVGRAVWYMKYGYMVYGHKKYWDTGYIDCSNFVSLVYKDFGYSITSAARKYNSVGQAVSGVYVKHQPGSNTKHVLMGTDKLKPGDIFTFWKEDSQGNRYIGHVALYMGKFNGKPTIIHTVKGYPTAIGLTDSFTYWYGEHFNGVRRVLNGSAYVPDAPYTDKGPVIPAKYQMKPGRVTMPGSLPEGF